MMRRWFWQFLPAAAVVLAAFLLYLNALPNPFLLDDHDAIATNPDVVQPARLGRLWVDDYWAGRGDDPNLYRPLTILSYRLNAAASGLSPEAFRLVNVLLLGLLGAGVLAWCRRWVGAAPATFAGLVVVAHPAAAETINIIVGRADLLAMLGVVAFLLVQQRAADRGWTLPLCVGGALAALLAMASKESGWIVLPLAAAQQWVLHKPEHATSLSRWRLAAVLGAPLLLVMVGRVIAVGALPAYAPPVAEFDLTTSPLRGLGFFQRLPGALDAAWFYVHQLLRPSPAWNQAPASAPQWSEFFTFFSNGAAAGLLALLLIAAATGYALRKRHWLAIAGVMFLANYLIVGNLLLPVGVYAASRLALPGVAALAMVVAFALEQARQRLPGAHRVLAYALVAVALLLAAGQVVNINETWREPSQRMQADAALQPDNAVTQYLAGASLMRPESGRPVSVSDVQRAATYFERSLALRPSVQASLSLANAHWQLGDDAAARGRYRFVLTQQPDNARALLGVAATSVRLGDRAAAEAALDKLDAQRDLPDALRAEASQVRAKLR